MGENVGDLADRHHGAAGRGDAVEQGVGVRRRGQVLAVGGAAERVRALAHERPCDHAADIERLGQLLGDRADRVEPLEPEMRLVRGDLEHRVGRGVADRLAAADVLLAEVADDVGAGRVAVAQDAGKGAARGERRRPAPAGSMAGCWETGPSGTARAARRSPNGRSACPCRRSLPPHCHMRLRYAAPRARGSDPAASRRARAAPGSAGAAARRAGRRGRRGPRGRPARCVRACRRRHRGDRRPAPNRCRPSRAPG